MKTEDRVRMFFEDETKDEDEDEVGLNRGRSQHIADKRAQHIADTSFGLRSGGERSEP